MNGENALEKHAEARLLDVLRANYDVIKAVIPKLMDDKRMAKLIVGAIRLNPRLANCTPASVLNAVINAASYGLEIRPGSAYLVPFARECTLLIDYRGKIDLALRSGLVTGISAEVVCARDEFDCSLGAEPRLIHKPLYFRRTEAGLEPVDGDERGPLVLAYAAARMKNGDPEFLLVSRQQILKVRDAQLNRLKAQGRDINSSPWVAWEEEMWKKTAVHRLCKRLPQRPEDQPIQELDEKLDKGDPLPWLGIQDDGKPILEASASAQDAAAEQRLADLRAEDARLLAERQKRKAEEAQQPQQESSGVEEEPDAAQEERDRVELQQRLQREQEQAARPTFGQQPKRKGGFGS